MNLRQIYFDVTETFSTLFNKYQINFFVSI